MLIQLFVRVQFYNLISFGILVAELLTFFVVIVRLPPPPPCSLAGHGTMRAPVLGLRRDWAMLSWATSTHPRPAT